MRYSIFLAIAALSGCVSEVPQPSSTAPFSGAVPVYQTPTTGVSARGYALSDTDLIRAYRSASPHSTFGNATGSVAFAVADIDGWLHRVDGPAGSIAFVLGAGALLGSSVPDEELTPLVSQKVASQSGCSWSGKTAVRGLRSDLNRTYAVFLDC
jgi:hypothetical protein